LDPNHPGNLFNGMIEPLIPYAFRGAIWYQGEGNAAQTYNLHYGEQLKALITEWRSRFGREFPFAWVQLPDFKAPQQKPVEESYWPIIREQMLKTLAVPKTGMAVALGLGEEKDIHPKNKQGVGFRLSRWALHDVYQQEGPAGGPLPVEHRLSGDGIVVTFKNTDGGLKSRDGKELKGFAIAGPDLKFVWAKAEIQGNTVHVSSPDVKQPIAVRYAWADNPIWSLENGAGLPATPFRTDADKISE
jgi:sialate O-acetylesterase